MKITGIDQQKCTQCLACAKACWGHLFTQRESQVVRADPHNWCSACGHCLAACPEDAIIYEADARALEFEGIVHPPSLCEYNTFLIHGSLGCTGLMRIKMKPLPIPHKHLFKERLHAFVA